jgi:hypothetical protein
MIPLACLLAKRSAERSGERTCHRWATRYARSSRCLCEIYVTCQLVFEILDWLFLRRFNWFTSKTVRKYCLTHWSHYYVSNSRQCRKQRPMVALDAPSRHYGGTSPIGCFAGNLSSTVYRYGLYQSLLSFFLRMDYQLF